MTSWLLREHFPFIYIYIYIHRLIWKTWVSLLYGCKVVAVRRALQRALAGPLLMSYFELKCPFASTAII